jgi:DNA mismatch repair protein MutL
MLDQLIELDQTLFHFHLRGFVSNTNSLRSNKNYQYFFINRRLVKDKVLSNSVYVPYRVYAETGQYPAAFLFLEIPAAMVDVNVHPAKYEVRFLQQSLVQKGIIDAIQRALSDSRPLPSFQLTGNPYIPRYSAPELNLPSASSAMEIPDEISPVTPGMSMPAPPARKMPQQGEYKIIGQYDNTYVVLSDEGGLILVDQHVAHERVLYELLLRKEEAHEMHRQNLLIPLVIELNPAQMMLMEDYTNHFRDLGFDLELFGNGTIIVRQIPELLADANYSAAIQRLLNDLEKLYRDGVLESFAEQMRKSMACQAAVKINMPLTKEKMEWLIAELLKTRTPQVCPHGRPIILRISHYEIEKNFRRI